MAIQKAALTEHAEAGRGSWIGQASYDPDLTLPYTPSPKMPKPIATPPW